MAALTIPDPSQFTELWSLFVEHVATQHQCTVRRLPGFDVTQTPLIGFKVPTRCSDLPDLMAFSAERDRRMRAEFGDLLLYGDAGACAAASARKLPYCELDPDAVLVDTVWLARFNETHRQLTGGGLKAKCER